MAVGVGCDIFVFEMVIVRMVAGVLLFVSVFVCVCVYLCL